MMSMEPINVDDVLARLEGADDPFLEFFRSDSVSLELYRLEAGATDPQEPHTEDEVYYIVSGVATLRVGGEDHPVEPGDVIHVERGVDHRFYDIEEDLVTLIVFVPPYGSLAAQPTEGTGG